MCEGLLITFFLFLGKNTADEGSTWVQTNKSQSEMESTKNKYNLHTVKEKTKLEFIRQKICVARHFNTDLNSIHNCFCLNVFL